MYQLTPLTSFSSNNANAVSWLTERLSNLGLVVKPSFDLQIARMAHLNCSCPYHGTQQCDCQIVVLLVYDSQGSPVTLLLHGQDGYASLFISETSNARENISLVEQITNSLKTPTHNSL